jgi:hypothetical protein
VTYGPDLNECALDLRPPTLPRTFPQNPHSLSVSTPHHTPATDRPDCPQPPRSKKCARAGGAVTWSPSTLHLRPPCTIPPNYAQPTRPKNRTNPKNGGIDPAQMYVSRQGMPNPPAKQKARLHPMLQRPSPWTGGHAPASNAPVTRGQGGKMRPNATQCYAKQAFQHPLQRRRLRSGVAPLRGCPHAPRRHVTFLTLPWVARLRW